MTRPYQPTTSMDEWGLRKDAKDKNAPVAQAGKEERAVTPLMPRAPEGVPLDCVVPGKLDNFKVYLRLRPYSPAEKAEMKRKNLDDTRSSIEFHENEKKITLEEAQSLGFKGKRVPPKKSWRGTMFAGMLWSFSPAGKQWDDDIDHTYRSQADACKQLLQNDALVKKCYSGYSQCILAHGAVGTGKTHTIFGSESDPGVAPRVLQSIFDGRKNYVAQREGETVIVGIELSLLRVWKEQVEDFTNIHAPAQVQITGAGELMGLQPLLIQDQQSLNDALSRLHKFGRRKEHRAHAVVHVNLLQKSVFDLGEASWGAEGKKTTEAMRGSTFTIVDVGAGGKHDNENQNDQKLIVKSQQAFARCFDRLKTTSTDENMAQIPVGGFPKLPYNDSKLTKLLCEQLGGNCQTHMVVCLSPALGHAVDNSMTLDFARNATLAKSHAFTREQADLERLRELNEEKLQVKEHKTVLNQNVVKVRDTLTARQDAINKRANEQRVLLNKKHDTEQKIEEADAQAERAVGAVEGLREWIANGAMNDDLRERLDTAQKQQTEARRDIARLKTEILVAECEAGDRDIEEVEDKLDEAKHEAADERSLVATTLETDALEIVEGWGDGADSDPASPPKVGDKVQFRKEGGWESGTLKAIAADGMNATVSSNLNGCNVEDEVELGSTRRQRRTAADKWDPVALLQAHLDEPLNAECPALKAFVTEEVEFAKERLSKRGSVPPTERSDLTVGVTKVNTEFLAFAADHMKKQLAGEEFAGLRAKAAAGFKRHMDKILTNPEDAFLVKLKALREQEKDMTAKKMISDARALTDMMPNGDVPDFDDLDAGFEILEATKERLRLALQYLRMREQFLDGLQQITEVVAGTIAKVVETRKEIEQAEQEAAAAEEEERRIEEEIVEEEKREEEKKKEEEEQKAKAAAAAKVAAQKKAAADAGCSCAVM